MCTQQGQARTGDSRVGLWEQKPKGELRVRIGTVLTASTWRSKRAPPSRHYNPAVTSCDSHVHSNGMSVDGPADMCALGLNSSTGRHVANELDIGIGVELGVPLHVRRERCARAWESLKNRMIRHCCFIRPRGYTAIGRVAGKLALSFV
jgi:hypothetical protein